MIKEQTKETTRRYGSKSGTFVEMAQRAIKADSASEFMAITSQMRFYDVCFWQLKELFHPEWIREALGADKFSEVVKNEVAYDRIFDKIRQMWRAKLLTKVQKEIELEAIFSLRAKLKKRGIDLNATAKGKIVTETMFSAWKETNENA